MQIEWCRLASPFGAVFCARSPYGWLALDFLDDTSSFSSFGRVRQAWHGASFQECPEKAAAWSDELFNPAHPTPHTVAVRCTPFQLLVWSALVKVPFGERISYIDLARRIDSRSARAVGNALAANQIAWLIPCHRVVHSDGRTGNFKWHPIRKLAMLEFETDFEGS